MAGGSGWLGLGLSTLASCISRDLKQQWRQRPRKCHFKKVALLQTLSRLFYLVQFVKCWQFVSKFRKRKWKSSSCVHVLHDTWNLAFSRGTRAVTAKKCTKKRDAELLFYQSKQIAFLLFSLTSPLCSGILKDCIEVQEKKMKVFVLCPRPPRHVKFGIFTSYSCSDGKEMYKKAWCTCRVVVLPI